MRLLPSSVKSLVPCLVLTVGTAVGCYTGSEENNLLLDLTISPPFITSVAPNFGSPPQNNPNGTFAATAVVINGRNLSAQGTQVLFERVPATIIFKTATEIQTSVPAGAKSGTLTVKRVVSSCNPDNRSGLYCVGTDFFVDCYSPTNKIYGDEIEVRQGSGVSIEFGTLDTFAFRSNVNASGTVDVICESIVSVRLFKESCVADDTILVKNPSVAFRTSFNPDLQQVLQFYVTASSATCRINVN